MNMKLTLIVSLSLSFFGSQFSYATTYVDLETVNGSGVTSIRSIDVDTATGDTWNFSDTMPLISDSDPLPGETNKTIYGGMASTYDADVGNSDIALSYFGGNPALNIQVLRNTDVPVEKTGTGMLIWNQADFLNGGDSGTINFETNKASISVTHDFRNGQGELRYVVNQGGRYYVSDTTASTENDTVSTLSDLSAEKWATISTDNLYTIGSSFIDITLDDVRGVGIYFHLAGSGKRRAYMRLNDVKVDIPEPSTCALYLGFVGIAVLSRRRR